MIGLIHCCENRFEFWICSSSRDCSSKQRYGVKFLLLLNLFFFPLAWCKAGLKWAEMTGSIICLCGMWKWHGALFSNSCSRSVFQGHGALWERSDECGGLEYSLLNSAVASATLPWQTLPCHICPALQLIARCTKLLRFHALLSEETELGFATLSVTYFWQYFMCLKTLHRFLFFTIVVEKNPNKFF